METDKLLRTKIGKKVKWGDKILLVQETTVFANGEDTFYSPCKDCFFGSAVSEYCPRYENGLVCFSNQRPDRSSVYFKRVGL